MSFLDDLPLVRRVSDNPNSHEADPYSDRPVASYLFRDKFDTGNATSPRTAVPGPGTLSLTGSRWSIAGGKLSWTANSSGSFATEHAEAPLIAKVPGRMLRGKFLRTGSAGFSAFGFFPDAASGVGTSQHYAAFYPSSTPSLLLRETAGEDTVATIATLEALTADVEYDCAIVLKSAGAFWFIKGGSQYPNWTLLFISDACNDSNVQAGVSNFNQAGTLDDFRIPQRLWNPQPFVTTSDATTLASFSMSLAGLADFILDINVTRGAGAGGTSNYFSVLMRADSGLSALANHWQLRINDDGTVVLIKIASGVETPTALFTIGTSVTRTVRAIVYGQTMRFFLHTPNSTTWTAYASNPFTTGTSFNETATNMLTLPVGSIGSGQNLVPNSVTIWKRDWSDGFPGSL